MATKWVGEIVCAWCDAQVRVGIEKDGRGSTYRLICPSCGIMSQVAFHYPAGQQITQILRSSPAVTKAGPVVSKAPRFIE